MGISRVNDGGEISDLRNKSNFKKCEQNMKRIQLGLHLPGVQTLWAHKTDQITEGDKNQGQIVRKTGNILGRKTLCWTSQYRKDRVDAEERPTREQESMAIGHADQTRGENWHRYIYVCDLGGRGWVGL